MLSTVILASREGRRNDEMMTKLHSSIVLLHAGRSFLRRSIPTSLTPSCPLNQTNKQNASSSKSK
jgi:hypothetical protein